MNVTRHRGWKRRFGVGIAAGLLIVACGADDDEGADSGSPPADTDDQLQDGVDTSGVDESDAGDANGDDGATQDQPCELCEIVGETFAGSFDFTDTTSGDSFSSDMTLEILPLELGPGEEQAHGDTTAGPRYVRSFAGRDSLLRVRLTQGGTQFTYGLLNTRTGHVILVNNASGKQLDFWPAGVGASDDYWELYQLTASLSGQELDVTGRNASGALPAPTFFSAVIVVLNAMSTADDLESAYEDREVRASETPVDVHGELLQAG